MAPDAGVAVMVLDPAADEQLAQTLMHALDRDLLTTTRVRARRITPSGIQPKRLTRHSSSISVRSSSDLRLVRDGATDRPWMRAGGPVATR